MVPTKSAKAQCYPSSKASEERTANLLNLAVVSAFIQFLVEFRAHKYWPTPQAIVNYIDFGGRRLKTLNSF